MPRVVTPRPPVFGELFGTASIELPELDEVDDVEAEEFVLGAVVAAEFGALMTPELLLTELQGADAVLSAPMPEVVKPVVGLSPPLVGLSPPPSKVDNAAAPGPPLVQGAGLATSVNGAGVVWELSPGGWPKSAPSGDVAPMPALGSACRVSANYRRVWPKSAPSGDVAPMLPGLDVSVCAALWPTPSAVMVSITATARRGFIWMTVRAEG